MKNIEVLNRIKTLLYDRKGESVIAFDISKVSSVADYFVIATGLADTHVKALSEYMITELKKEGIAPYMHEGLSSGEWVCVDYNNIIVHIMREKERNYYNLESIWGGCKKV